MAKAMWKSWFLSQDFQYSHMISHSIAMIFCLSYLVHPNVEFMHDEIPMKFQQSFSWPSFRVTFLTRLSGWSGWNGLTVATIVRGRRTDGWRPEPPRNPWVVGRWSDHFWRRRQSGRRPWPNWAWNWNPQQKSRIILSYRRIIPIKCLTIHAMEI